MKSSTKTLLALHILLMVYSTSNVLSKFAADTEVMSWEFLGFYAAIIAILGVYAIGWQQVIKRMPLTTAYANKAATIVWGIVFGLVIFDEPVTPLMLLGALVIVCGIVLYAIEEGRVQKERVRAMNEQVEGPVVHPGTGASADGGPKGGDRA